MCLFYCINKVAGYAVGGGHVLHMVCDLTIAAANAIFGQTGPKVPRLYYNMVPTMNSQEKMWHVVSNESNQKSYWFCKLQVGSFDAGYGASIMCRLVSFLDWISCIFTHLLVYVNNFECLYTSFDCGTRIDWPQKST